MWRSRVKEVTIMLGIYIIANVVMKPNEPVVSSGTRLFMIICSFFKPNPSAMPLGRKLKICADE